MFTFEPKVALSLDDGACPVGHPILNQEADVDHDGGPHQLRHVTAITGDASERARSLEWEPHGEREGCRVRYARRPGSWSQVTCDAPFSIF